MERVFQSTRPRGTRLVRLLEAAGRHVSIHASARDATWGAGRAPRGARVSIHASARDATQWYAPQYARFVFQSTRPRGTRPGSPGVRYKSSCFNPRVREGRDDHALPSYVTILRFQSTRPRGTRHPLNR